MSSGLPLFDSAPDAFPGRRWQWHVHGRYLVITRDGWPSPRTKRTVHRYDDSCVAATEAEAREILTAEHGPLSRHHQWLSFQRGAEARS